MPEAQGGIGLGWVELAVLLEQVGAHVAPAPILQHVVALELLVRAGSPLVPAVLSGETVATVAFTPVRGARVRRRVAPRRHDRTGRVRTVADVAIVRTDDAVFAVELDTRPAGRAGRRWIARASSAGCVSTPRPLNVLVATIWSSCSSTWARWPTPAELLGIGSAALDLAVAYAKEREQFGRPIGSFQAVKHRCADMLVDVEGMRSAVYYAAWCIAADDRDRSVAASTAKTWCSDAGRRVTASCLQVHGGIGFTWESDVHLYLKRAQLDEVSFGDAVFHRSRLAERLRARVDAGESVI